MGANDRKISVTLDVGAEISKYKDKMEEVQKGLNALHLSDDLKTEFKNIFSEYKNEISNLERLTKNKELTPVNEKEVKHSVERIDKLYKNLITKLGSKGYKTSVLEQDYKALEEMVKMQNLYTKATKDTEEELRNEEKHLKAIKKLVSDSETEFKKASKAQKGIETSLNKETKEYDKLKKSQQDYNSQLKEAEAERRRLRSQFNPDAEENKGKKWNETEKAVNNLQQQHDIKKKISEVNEEIAKKENEINELKNKQAKATEVAEKAQEEYNKTQQKYNDEISQSEKKVDNLKKQLDDLRTNSLNKIKEDLEKSGIDWEKYGVDIKTINSFDDLKDSIDKINSSAAEGVKDTMSVISTSINEAGEAAKVAKTSFSDAARELLATEENVKDIERMRDSIVRFFSIGNAVRLFKRAIRSAFETVKDLDKVMTETAVVTDFSVADMWKQLPEYTERANKLGVTIHDVYEASTLYYQQGLKTNEVMSVTNATLKMARIAGLDAAEATDRMTNALRGFNMEITETNADRVADVYSKLAAISASNVDEISTAMTKTASLASNANMKFETTAAFLAQIIETTRESAETAGTALKTVIARFSEVKQLFSKGELLGVDGEGEAIDVNKVSKALKTAGINLNEYLTGAKGLDEIFMELASKWDSLDQVQQRYIATMAAGSRQQSRFIAMMQNYKRTTELVTAAENAAGASNEQYEKTLESLESKLNKLKNSWDTFLLDITNNTVIKFVVDSLNTFLTVTNKISNELPGPISTLGKLFTTFAMGKVVKNLVGPGGPLSKWLQAWREGKELTNGFSGELGFFMRKLVGLGPVSTNDAQAIGQLNENAIIGGKGLKNFSEAIGLTIKQLMGITAAITAIIVVIKIIKALSPEAQLERLNKKLEENIKKTNELNEEYLNLSNTWDKLQEQYRNIETLKENTEAWKEAVNGVNEEVSNLINKYPELAKYTTYVNGMMKLSSEGIQKVTERTRKSMISSANISFRIEQQRNQKAENNASRAGWNVANLDEFNVGNLYQKALDLIKDQETKVDFYTLLRNEDKYKEDTEDNIRFFTENKDNIDAIQQYLDKYFEAVINPSTAAASLLNQYAAESFSGENKDLAYNYLQKLGKGETVEKRQKEAEDFINKNVTKKNEEIIKKILSGSLKNSDIDAAKELLEFFTDDEFGNVIRNAIETARQEKQEDAEYSYQTDSNKFANASKFAYDMQQAETFSDENRTSLIQEYGLKDTDFINLGDSVYALNIESITQEEFNQKLNDVINELIQAYLETAIMTGDWSAYNEVQKTAGYYALNQVGTEKTEDYYKGARSSFMNSEAWENYNTELGENNLAAKAVAEENKELANSLYSSANAASKLLSKFQELTDVIKDNAEALENDDIKAIAEVTKAFNKAFGTDLSEEFVKNNKSALIDFANGVENAYDQISDAILQSFVNTDGIKSEVADLYTFIQGQDWDINGQMVLDSGPYFDILNQILNAGGQAAAELEEAFRKAGITISWDTTEWEEIEEVTGRHGEIETIRVPKKRVATLTNALGQQERINARSGGSKSSGGGGSSKPKYWDNPYDELYNLLEKQNEALRTREKLEREYDRILKDRSKSAKELLQNSLDEITNLRKELGIQEQIQAGRVRMINELGSKGHRDSEGNLRSFDEWGASNYAHYDFERNVVVIDWAAIDRINDPDKGGAIEAYISKLEELSSSFEETQDKIEEMKDLIQEIRERGMKEYIDYEKRALDAIIAREQKVIDEYSALSDTINESNSNILSSLRESIDLERQIRDNTKTEQDIADKEARLAYLQRDTSGANQQEILKLQKELDQARESYGDTLVDQSIENLEKENEKAQEQRQQQIDIMQAQLNWMEETGGFWEEVYSLFEGSFDENGNVIEDSKLMNLIRQAEGYRGMSKFGKQNFDNDLTQETKQAYEGYMNWTGQGQGDDSAIIEETPVSENPYPSASGNLGGLNRYINFGDRSDAVRQLQAGLNDLIRDNMLGGPTIDEDGSYGPATKQKVALLQSTLNEYFGSGLRVDGYWGPRTYEALMNTHLNQYKAGGLVTSTGLAWLDGTKSSPEMVLSARDTENFIALRNALTQMVAQGGGKSGDNYFDIQINVDELGSDYDVDQLADKVKRQIVQDSMYRNVNAINYLR